VQTEVSDFIRAPVRVVRDVAVVHMRQRGYRVTQWDGHSGTRVWATTARASLILILEPHAHGCIATLTGVGEWAVVEGLHRSASPSVRHGVLRIMLALIALAAGEQQLRSPGPSDPWTL
jgi:hypothetical protein